MKKRFYFLLTALFSILLSSQTFDWEKTFAGSNDEVFIDNIEDGAGNYIFSGTSNSNDGDLTLNYGLQDIFVVKTDGGGNYLWKKTFGGNNDDVILDLEKSNDGGVVFVSKSKSNSNNFSTNLGDFDFWVTKLDSNGNVVWNFPFAGSGVENNAKIIPIGTGYVVALETNSTDGEFAHSTTSGNNIWLLKLSETGAVIWKNRLQGNGEEIIKQLVPIDASIFGILLVSSSSDGDFVSNTSTASKSFFMRLNSSGNIISNAMVESADPAKANNIENIKMTSLGQFLLSGSENVSVVFGSTTYNNVDAVMALVSASGVLSWKRNYVNTSGPYFERAVLSEVANDNNFIFIIVNKNNNDAQNIQNIMLKLDSNGNLLNTFIISTNYNFIKYFDIHKLISGIMALSFTSINDAGPDTAFHSIQFINDTGTLNQSSSIKVNNSILNAYAYASSLLTNNDEIISFWTHRNAWNSTPQNGNNVWFSKWNIPINYLSLDEELEISKSIIIYPNPVSEFLNIVLPQDEKLEIIKIYNSAGQLTKIENAKKIDVSSFVKGKYIFEIKTNKSVTRKSILVQ